jgi:hypothetical protein
VQRDVNWTLVHEAAIWSVYYLSIRIRTLFRLPRRRPSIWFTPDVPRPWYLVRAAAAWAHIRVARSPAEADAAFYFDDTTRADPPAPGHARHFNFGCADISKSHVAAVFETVFGYPLTIDPTTWTGPAVEKSEANGLHDGRVVECPLTPAPGKTYQRLIETSDGAFSYDLRTPCVSGRPVVVWRKKKRAGDRFAIENLAVTEMRPEDVYSAAELEQIARFSKAMGLDWGGLDILREHATGRIYIVDVNKTDVGPVLALPWLSKMSSTRALASALLGLVADASTGRIPTGL